MRATASIALLLANSASAFNVQGFFGKTVQPRAATQAASAKWSPRVASDPLKMSLATPASPTTSAGSTDALEEYVQKHGGNRPIRKVLIANNGMAATKSILSMRKWAYFELGDENAVQFVAMATPEDLKANAEFIKLADAYVEVPAGKNSNNYANVDIIVNVAKEYNVDAVWPGWGHASENPKLPTALTELGIKFIGPTAPVMSVLGDKIAANILAQTANVPSIPWSGSWGNEGDDGPLQANLQEDGTIPLDIFNKAMVTTVEEAVDAAKRIGFPVMLKASEGGGGKGIRMNDNEEELRANFPQVEAEVPGSPMFMMQLCTGARHLEVQIVGDEHGNAVAINGRDCSTQRRFQKIFEEGPPTIAKADTFLEMQRAAQRLTQQIGYIGAGTVEYLYKAETDEFFFLELNPRLQVEHPVTEGLSLVNLPATQLQVAMGIPLNRIPDIRRFYGRKDAEEGDGPIDFMTEAYKEIDTHVIAARITAENPDEGFKPTSGTIERVNFQSTSNVWGYFSVGANGGIHEFADSQFGHLFAKGSTREQARKALVLALKEIEVRGDIRTTVDYLVQLLETEAFKENTIDTSWLDGIIREKSVSTELDPHVTVAAAAIYRAYAQVQAGEANMVEALGMGQLGMGALKSLNNFPIEIAYKDIKYNFQVQRTSADVYTFTINGSSFEAKVRESPDGSLLVEYDGMTSKIVGFEEPLGLRVIVDGTTCLLPNIFDPSELRTDVTGKVVRYLQDDGAQVEAGAPFVEVEAMKMIMPLKASESGAIKHELSAGSIISTGDLLASLTLKDPSKVKKILQFDGE
jgi:acetyl-CoA carboxylase/biotin carboxylase 1